MQALCAPLRRQPRIVGSRPVHHAQSSLTQCSTLSCVPGRSLLEGNQFTGTVPSSMLSWFKKLKYCQLGTNDWTCPLPSGVEDLCHVWKCSNTTTPITVA